LLECLRDRQDDLLRFCSDTRVWPTNNISERDLRPLKTRQKTSGRLESADPTVAASTNVAMTRAGCTAKVCVEREL